MTCIHATRFVHSLIQVWSWCCQLHDVTIVCLDSRVFLYQDKKVIFSKSTSIIYGMPPFRPSIIHGTCLGMLTSRGWHACSNACSYSYHQRRCKLTSCLFIPNSLSSYRFIHAQPRWSTLRLGWSFMVIGQFNIVTIHAFIPAYL